MTHEYTVLTGGLVLRTGAGDTEPHPTAIAWAAGTVLAVGSDAEVGAISRGDSHFANLGGAVVRSRNGAALEPGDEADFEIVDATSGALLARVRGGHIAEGAFPGLEPA